MKKFLISKDEAVSITKILLGLTFIVVSILHIKSTYIAPAKAQSASDYDYVTTWTTTKLLTMSISNNGDIGGLKIALGTSDWNVQIKDSSGNAVYTENWQSPMPDSGITFNGSKAATSATAGLDPTKWLFSSTQVNSDKNIGNLTFAKADVGTLNLGTLTNLGGNTSRIGNGTYNSTSFGTQSLAGSCKTNEMNWCLSPTGGYGWLESVNDNSNDNSVGSTGILMPLQWTVYGKIN